MSYSHLRANCLVLSSSVIVLRNCKCGVILLVFLIWDICSLSIICGQRALALHPVLLGSPGFSALLLNPA